MILSKLDYANRFTEPELEIIYSAAKTVVAVEVWLDKYRLAEHVDTEDPRVHAGLHALEDAGLIQPGRADEILGNQSTATEQPPVTAVPGSVVIDGVQHAVNVSSDGTVTFEDGRWSTTNALSSQGYEVAV